MVFFADRPNNPIEVVKKEHYTEATLFPVLSMENLLASSPHQALLKKIEALVDLPSQYYQALYKPLIKNFSEFVQVLPEENYGEVASLLNRGLGTAYHFLNHFKTTASERNNHLLFYVLFSSALLRRVGQVTVNRKINLSTPEGFFLNTWQPFQSSLVEAGSHYKIRHLSELFNEALPSMTILLARQLMPLEGFLWIAEREDMLKIWLGILTHQEETMRVYEPELIIAQKYAQEAFNFQGYPIFVDVLTPNEVAEAEAFLSWIKTQLGKKLLSVNQKDSYIHVTEDGTFLETEPLVAEYLTSNKRKIGSEVIYHQLDKLKVSQNSASKKEKVAYAAEGKKSIEGGHKVLQKGAYFSNKTSPATTGKKEANPSGGHTMKTGIVVESRALFDKIGAIPSLSKFIMPALGLLIAKQIFLPTLTDMVKKFDFDPFG